MIELDDTSTFYLVLTLAGAIVATYTLIFQRRLRRDRLRLEEASRLGFTRASGQFPYIDPELCIGCGTCVSVCPEKDVLGLFGGQAIVVNGVRCVGIAYCEAACPVGAIEVGLGDVKGRADLPVLSADNETTVPGLFIAGELGGLSLVRNAIEQGSKTVRSIHSRAVGLPVKPSLDTTLLIIGSGPAGISAALTAIELGLEYLVVEQEKDLGGTVYNYPRRKLVHTQPVDVPLGGRIEEGEHSKEDLLSMFEELTERNHVRFAFGERVVGVERDTDGLLVRSLVSDTESCKESDGETAGRTHEIVRRSRFVLLALGRRGSPRKLGVPGEDLPKVLYQVRDAELYSGKKILCVGGGDSAVEAAMGLGAQAGTEVTLSYRKNRFARIKSKNQQRLERAQKNGQVRVVFQSNLKEITLDSAVLERNNETTTIDNDFVFIFAGGEPPFGLLEKAGVRFGDQEAEP